MPGSKAARYAICCRPMIVIVLLCCGGGTLAESPRLAGQWMQDGFAVSRFEIGGTEARNNPLRQPLAKPFSGNELFARFRIRYDAATIDTPETDEGEFIVFWMDDADGGNSATHSGGVPNLGIHVSLGKNRFMARYSPSAERFARELEGDRDFLVVGRLWKSSPGPQQPFDQLDLWVDPEPEDELKPDASAKSARAIHQVKWIGFSTGAKTELDDRITVWDIDLADTWEKVLGLPPKQESATSQPLTRSEPTVRFAADVFPILKHRCFECHSGDDAVEGIRLDVLDELLNHTAPRKAGESRLIQLVAAHEMPPEGEPVPDSELRVLSTWIDEGLDWDEQLLPTPVPTTDHWAFQPIRRPPVPSIKRSDWVRTPVDAFVGRAHQRLGLTPAPPADATTLSRRLSLDLIGMPVGDEFRTLEWREQIERLLSHPGYGERYARYWLDVARWAESNGHQHNRFRPHAWRYRDWVINAFNTDLTYDQFLRQQIAGDEIQPYRDEHLAASGFLAAARYSGNELDKDIQRNDILVDIANTTAGAFLALTLECAQCHTHKFDPIRIRDYYRFQAFFAKGQPGNIVFARNQQEAETRIRERWQIFDKVHARLVNIKRKQGHPEPIYVIPKSVVAGMRPEEKSRFRELEKQIAALEQTWGYYSPVTSAVKLEIAPHEMRWPLPRDPNVLGELQTTVLIRGEVAGRGPQVKPGWPLVFGETHRESVSRKPRTALADWMTHADHPLTSRVWVNRMWQWHFGRGIVETSGDFGTQGGTPSHPELLDYLASELVDSGWSTRHIHRLILNSATYRQSSRNSPSNAAIDPENRMLWRWTPRRLEAEAIRDSILAVSGQLDSDRGGPSVDADSNRRSIYLAQRRDNFPLQQVLFDGSNGTVSCSRRRVSINSLQPLWLLNSEFIQRSASELAKRSGSAAEAFRLAVGREPTPPELTKLDSLVTEFGLESACAAILNLSEFIYIP